MTFCRFLKSDWSDQFVLNAKIQNPMKSLRIDEIVVVCLHTCT